MNHTVTAFTSNAPNTIMMPGLFQETIELITESYEYFCFQDQLMDSGMLEGVTPEMEIILSNEMSRVTMRLTSVMAWLMARKAVVSGQLSDEEACQDFSIQGQSFCLQQPSDLWPLMPDYMRYLLEQSLQLYQRVLRLDESLLDR